MSVETVAIPTENGIYGFVDEQAYHADRGSLSVSGAKLLLPPSCPAKFKQRMDNPPPIKREWDFGHVAHRLLLGKGADIAVLDPQVHGLKKDGTVADSPRATATWKDADAAARGRGQVPVHIADFNKAREMADKVLAHPRIGGWFDPDKGAAEQSVYATDPLSSVRLRMRADWLWMGAPDGRMWCLDYKTAVTANPDELIRTFWKLGYYMQAAWYEWVLRLAKIAADPAFVFVVQEKEPPFLVSVVEYDAEAMAEGARRNRDAIDLYARCRDAGEWPGYSDDILPLSLPPYGFRQQTMNDLFTDREDFDE